MSEFPRLWPEDELPDELRPSRGKGALESLLEQPLTFDAPAPAPPAPPEPTERRTIRRMLAERTGQAQPSPFEAAIARRLSFEPAAAPPVEPAVSGGVFERVVNSPLSFGTAAPAAPQPQTAPVQLDANGFPIGASETSAALGAGDRPTTLRADTPEIAPGQPPSGPLHEQRFQAVEAAQRALAAPLPPESLPSATSLPPLPPTTAAAQETLTGRLNEGIRRSLQEHEAAGRAQTDEQLRALGRAVGLPDSPETLQRARYALELGEAIAGAGPGNVGAAGAKGAARLSAQGLAERARLVDANIAGGIARDVAESQVDNFIAGLAREGKIPTAYLERAAETAAEGAAKAATDATEAAAPRVANIDLTKFDEPLRPIIENAVNRLAPDAVEAARRGEMPEEVTRELAAKVGLTSEQFIRRARSGKAYNAEELLALDSAMATTAREIRDVAAQMTANPTQTTDAMKAELAALTLQATGLAKAAVGARAEAGRALSAMRFLRQASDSPTRLQHALQMIGDAANDPDTVAKLAQAAEDPVELFALVRKLQAPSAWRAFDAYYKANLLSAPLTQIRNVIGNTGALALILPERGAAAALDVVRSKITGQARERYFQDVVSETEGWAASFLTAARKAGDILSRGYSAEDAQVLELAGRYAPLSEFRVAGRRLGVVGDVIEAPFRALSAGDAFFRTLAEQGELYVLAYRKAISEGLSGNAVRQRALEIVAEPPRALVEAAEKAGRYRTYTNTLDDLGKGLQQLARVPGVNLVLPFIATPYNIMKYELERSPLGVLGVAKGLAQHEAAGAVEDRAARWLIGTGVATALFGQALAGNLTGAAPENQAERDLFYRAGKLPYSIRIGGNWYSYSQITGLSTTLALTASVAEAYKGTGHADELTTREWLQAVWQAGGVLTDKPMLLGLKNIQDALESPSRAEQIAGGIVRGLVPASSLLGVTARAIDPTIRGTEGIGERLQAGIPFASQHLPARLDAYGRPVVRDQSGVEAFFNPIGRSEVVDDPIDRELQRLTEATGEALGPRPIDRNARSGGQRLTRDERRALQGTFGDLAYEALAALLGSGGYLSAKDDDERAEMVKTVVSRMRTAAGRGAAGVVPQYEAVKAVVDTRTRGATPQRTITGELARRQATPTPPWQTIQRMLAERQAAATPMPPATDGQPQRRIFEELLRRRAESQGEPTPEPIRFRVPSSG